MLSRKPFRGAADTSRVSTSPAENKGARYLRSLKPYETPFAAERLMEIRLLVLLKCYTFQR